MVLLLPRTPDAAEPHAADVASLDIVAPMRRASKSLRAIQSHAQPGFANTEMVSNRCDRIQWLGLEE